MSTRLGSAGTNLAYASQKARLGANAILGVSMAICRAGAAAHEMALYEYIAHIAKRPTDRFVMPVPAFNVINGGSHAGNRLACQDRNPAWLNRCHDPSRICSVVRWPC